MDEKGGKRLGKGGHNANALLREERCAEKEARENSKNRECEGKREGIVELEQDEASAAAERDDGKGAHKDKRNEGDEYLAEQAQAACVVHIDEKHYAADPGEQKPAYDEGGHKREGGPT